MNECHELMMMMIVMMNRYTIQMTIGLSLLSVASCVVVVNYVALQ